jgi:alpha-beta hydrolase superfamily lysophospholipase
MILIIKFILLVSSFSYAHTFSSKVASKYSTAVTAHVGIFNPACAEQGQVLYLHGHADRFENHVPLFEFLNSMCLRVVTFDWPGHGESKLGSLDLYPFSGLQDLALEIFNAYTEGHGGPRILMAWSFGGLIGTRILQSPENIFSASILFVPALSVHLATGGDGIIRTQTLTQTKHPLVKAKPSFISPLQTPLFALRNLISGFVAIHHAFATVPTLVILPEAKEDLYVDINDVENYFKIQNDKSRLRILNCKGAKHALDFEPKPYQDEIQNEIKKFIQTFNHPGAQWKNLPSPKPLSETAALCNYR